MRVSLVIDRILKSSSPVCSKKKRMAGKMKNHSVVVVYVHAFVRDQRRNDESVSSVPRLDVSEKRDLRSLHPSVRVSLCVRVCVVALVFFSTLSKLTL